MNKVEIYGRWYYIGEKQELWLVDLNNPELTEFLEQKAREVEKELGLQHGYINHAEVADWCTSDKTILVNFYHCEG